LPVTATRFTSAMSVMGLLRRGTIFSHGREISFQISIKFGTPRKEDNDG
jgi:hypothetical protein